MTTLTPRRTAGTLASLATAAALAAGALAGCGGDGEGAQTDCSLSDCTITFDRGVDARTEVLGIGVELVSAGDGEATVEVAGQEVTMPVEGSREVAGLTVTVRSVTSDEVVVHVAR